MNGKWLIKVLKRPDSVLVHIKSIDILTCYEVDQIDIAANGGNQQMILISFIDLFRIITIVNRVDDF